MLIKENIKQELTFILEVKIQTEDFLVKYH